MPVSRRRVVRCRTRMRCVNDTSRMYVHLYVTITYRHQLAGMMLPIMRRAGPLVPVAGGEGFSGDVEGLVPRWTCCAEAAPESRRATFAPSPCLYPGCHPASVLHHQTEPPSTCTSCYSCSWLLCSAFIFPPLCSLRTALWRSTVRRRAPPTMPTAADSSIRRLFSPQSASPNWPHPPR